MMPVLFQTLNSISAEKNSTVIFPLPIDLITNLLHGEKEKEDKELIDYIQS